MLGCPAEIEKQKTELCPRSQERKRFQGAETCCDLILTTLPLVRSFGTPLSEFSVLEYPSAVAKSGPLKVNLTSDNKEKFLGTKSSESS